MLFAGCVVGVYVWSILWCDECGESCECWCGAVWIVVWWWGDVRCSVVCDWCCGAWFGVECGVVWLVMSCKGITVAQECQRARLAASCKCNLHKCLGSVSYKSVKQRCLAEWVLRKRVQVSYKSAWQECLASVSLQPNGFKKRLVASSLQLPGVDSVHPTAIPEMLVTWQPNGS